MAILLATLNYNLLIYKDIWWSWRELNPRPQALRLWYYMLSPAIEFNWLLPTEQGVQTAISVRI